MGCARQPRLVNFPAQGEPDRLVHRGSTAPVGRLPPIEAPGSSRPGSLMCPQANDAGWDIAAIGEGESTLLSLIAAKGDPAGITGVTGRGCHHGREVRSTICEGLCGEVLEPRTHTAAADQFRGSESYSMSGLEVRSQARG